MFRLLNVITLIRAAPGRMFSMSSVANVDYTHTVIGGGAVGIAIASELAKDDSASVLLVEKNANIGQETSSRNSEVVHAGIYYPRDSLKARLCIEGKNLIYNEASCNGVAVQKVGKWVVAQNDIEDAYLEHLYHNSQELGVPTHFVPLSKAKYIEPAIVANRSILESPTSGILSAHNLIDYLYSMFQSRGGELALNSAVVALHPLASTASRGYTLQVEDVQNKEKINITSETVINSAGLYADMVSNMLLPQERHVHYAYAKGTYFTPTTGILPVRRLVYPTPIKGLKGLGTHLTIDLEGQIKFGPDRELVDNLQYSPSSENIPRAYEEIIKYYPCISSPSDLVASYSGIRPQLKNESTEFQDFIIREEKGFPGFINLLNIDSPGLTSSMAIGKYVKGLLY